MRRFILISPLLLAACMARPPVVEPQVAQPTAISQRTAGELVKEFDMSAPAISQHLNVLREAGLVTTRAEGQSRIQALNPEGFDDLEAWLQRTRAVWSSRLDALERELRAEDAANEKKAKKKTSS